MIKVLDNSQIEEISPPSTQSEGYQVEERRQSQKSNRRTRNNRYLMNRDTTQLKLIQYNIGRRYDSMAQLLRHPEIASVDIIAIQKPCVRKDIKATHNLTGGLFHVALPPSEKRPRVCLHIHRKIDTSKRRVHSYYS